MIVKFSDYQTSKISVRSDKSNYCILHKLKQYLVVANGVFNDKNEQIAPKALIGSGLDKDNIWAITNYYIFANGVFFNLETKFLISNQVFSDLKKKDILFYLEKLIFTTKGSYDYHGIKIKWLYENDKIIKSSKEFLVVSRGIFNHQGTKIGNLTNIDEEIADFMIILKAEYVYIVSEGMFDCQGNKINDFINYEDILGAWDELIATKFFNFNKKDEVLIPLEDMGQEIVISPIFQVVDDLVLTSFNVFKIFDNSLIKIHSGVVSKMTTNFIVENGNIWVLNETKSSYDDLNLKATEADVLDHFFITNKKIISWKKIPIDVNFLVSSKTIIAFNKGIYFIEIKKLLLKELTLDDIWLVTDRFIMLENHFYDYQGEKFCNPKNLMKDDIKTAQDWFLVTKSLIFNFNSNKNNIFKVFNFKFSDDFKILSSSETLFYTNKGLFNFETFNVITLEQLGSFKKEVIQEIWRQYIFTNNITFDTFFEKLTNIELLEANKNFFIKSDGFWARNASSYYFKKLVKDEIKHVADNFAVINDAIVFYQDDKFIVQDLPRLNQENFVIKGRFIITLRGTFNDEGKKIDVCEIRAPFSSQADFLFTNQEIISFFNQYYSAREIKDTSGQLAISKNLILSKTAILTSSKITNKSTKVITNELTVINLYQDFSPYEKDHILKVAANFIITPQNVFVFKAQQLKLEKITVNMTNNFQPVANLSLTDIYDYLPNVLIISNGVIILDQDEKINFIKDYDISKNDIWEKTNNYIIIRKFIITNNGEFKKNNFLKTDILRAEDDFILTFSGKFALSELW